MTTAKTVAGANKPGKALGPGPSPAARDRLIGESAWKTVVVGASTGGVEALATVLRAFPEDCPPTLIVQHISVGFLEGLARRLNDMCRAEVKPAEDGAPIRAGQVLMAPDGECHLTIAAHDARVALVPGAQVGGHRPAVDVLFNSAVRLGDQALAVILSGMGRDGATGMQRIREAGGYTISQDRATAAVYGMPRAAADLGAVCQQLPLDEIGPALIKAARRSHAGAFDG